MNALSPFSIRPNPNTRHEQVSEAMLIENGRRIITAKQAVEHIERNALLMATCQAELTEWRRTLRMLQAERKALRRTAQLRLF